MLSYVYMMDNMSTDAQIGIVMNKLYGRYLCIDQMPHTVC